MSMFLILALNAAAVAAGMLIHKYWPGFSVAKVEAAVVAEVEKVAPNLKADAMAAVAHAEHWLLNTLEEDAAIAKALASKATKELLLKAHIATLSAALPPAAPPAP